VDVVRESQQLRHDVRNQVRMVQEADAPLRRLLGDDGKIPGIAHVNHILDERLQWKEHN
jgi:hypothetical protein